MLKSYTIVEGLDKLRKLGIIPEDLPSESKLARRMFAEYFTTVQDYPDCFTYSDEPRTKRSNEEKNVMAIYMQAYGRTLSLNDAVKLLKSSFECIGILIHTGALLESEDIGWKKEFIGSFFRYIREDEYIAIDYFDMNIKVSAIPKEIKYTEVNKAMLADERYVTF